jgi:hypothetical protein
MRRDSALCDTHSVARMERGMSVLQKSLISSLVVIHLAANLWHASAHTQLMIDLPPIKLAFVIVVILLAPVACGIFVWTRFETAALSVLTLSMLGALVFGVYHHYILVSPDNIAHLPDGPPAAHARFIDSAAILALLELATAMYAAYWLGARRVR